MECVGRLVDADEERLAAPPASARRRTALSLAAAAAAASVGWPWTNTYGALKVIPSTDSRVPEFGSGEGGAAAVFAERLPMRRDLAGPAKSKATMREATASAVKREVRWCQANGGTPGLEFWLLLGHPRLVTLSNF